MFCLANLDHRIADADSLPFCISHASKLSLHPLSRNLEFIQTAGKGKTRNGPKKIHFNDTFEGFRDANASQPDIATQKLQSQEADRNVLKLPRVSEEGLESGSSEAAATPAEEGGGLNEDSKPIQEATQVFVDFGKFEAPRADPEIEETPAKVLVEYEDYQPQSTAPPAQGESVRFFRVLVPKEKVRVEM